MKFPYFLGGLGKSKIHRYRVECYPFDSKSRLLLTRELFILEVKVEAHLIHCISMLLLPCLLSCMHFINALFSVIQMARNPETMVKHAHTRIAVHRLSIVVGIG